MQLPPLTSNSIGFVEPLTFIVAIAVLCALYITWLVARLRRLHRRAGAACHALEAAEHARAEAALRWARESHSEFTASVKEAAAAVIEAKGNMGSPHVENNLTRALRKVFHGSGLPDSVVEANRRLTVARQVYNDAVRDTLALRRARIPRALRLAAGLARPQYFDIDTDMTA